MQKIANDLSVRLSTCAGMSFLSPKQTRVRECVVQVFVRIRVLLLARQICPIFLTAPPLTKRQKVV